MRIEAYDHRGCPIVRHEWGWHGNGVSRCLLLFEEEELKYEISNVAYASGDVARINDNYGHDLLGDKSEYYLHQWKDVCEDGNYERVKKTLGLAFGEVEQLLYRYTAQSNRRCSVIDNDDSHERVEYVVELKAPETMSYTTCEYLLRLIEEYAVNRVLEDWASIAFPEVMERWKLKAVETADKIKHARSYCGSAHRVKPSII